MAEKLIKLCTGKMGDYILQQIPGLIEYRLSLLHASDEVANTQSNISNEDLCAKPHKRASDEISDHEIKRSRQEKQLTQQNATAEINLGQSDDGALALENALLLIRQLNDKLLEAKDGYTRMKNSWETLSKENNAHRTSNRNQKTLDIVIAENEELKQTYQVLSSKHNGLQKELENLRAKKKVSNHACDNCGKEVEKIVYCSNDCLQKYMYVFFCI